MPVKTVHVVHAHPEPRSFTAAMRDVVVSHFRDVGAHVTISNLYEMNFNPVASAADFGIRRQSDHLIYTLEQRHAYSNGTIAPDIAEELTKIVSANLIVFTFPIFWFGTPAILKGWFDRVLISGVCYGGKRIYENGGLAGRKALAVFGLGGRPHMFGPGSIHGALTSGMLRHFLQGTLGYVGFDVYEPFVAWHVPYVSHEARTRILLDLRDQLKDLDARSTMGMPRTSDFGPLFEPLKVPQ